MHRAARRPGCRPRRLRHGCWRANRRRVGWEVIATSRPLESPRGARSIYVG
jgi:hypothetical protein